MGKLLSLIIALSGAILSGQESVTFTGIIVDPSGARIPVADVKLVLPGSKEVVATAKLVATAGTSVGSFVISAPPSQEYELQVQTLGLKSAQVKIGKAQPGQRINIGNVVMEVLPTDIGGYYQPGPLVPVIRFPIAEPLEDIERSVCEILKDKKRFFNTEVRLRTEIAPPGLDTGYLLFDNCPNGQLGFAPATSAVTHDWTYRTMKGYLQQQYSAIATLRGKLDYYLLVGRPPAYYFRIEEVSDLSQGTRSGAIVYPKRKK
jgi:hypothetical protein